MASNDLKIDPRAYLQVQLAIQQHRLDLHYPELVRHLPTVNVARPTALDCRVFQEIKAAVDGFTEGLVINPIPPAPASIISAGDFTIATQADGAPLRLTRAELRKHISAVGPTGSGKTSLLQPLGLQLLQASVHLIVPDYKNDFTLLAALHPDFIHLHAGAPINLLEQPLFLSRADHLNNLMTCFVRSYFGGEHQRQVIHETLTELFLRYEHPCVQDWLRFVEQRSSAKFTYQRRDAYDGLRLRLTRLLASYPGPCRTRIGIPVALRCQRSLYLGSTTQSDNDDFLTALAVTTQWLHNRHYDIRDQLTHVVFLDEGLLSFGPANRIDGPVLQPYIPLLREHSMALVALFASSDSNNILRSNMYTTIALPPNNSNEAGAISTILGLNPAQREYYTDRLSIGQAIVRTGKWGRPLLVTFPPLAYDKTVPASVWQAAIERTNQLAPQTAPTITITADATTNQSAAPPVPGHAGPLTPGQERALRRIATGPFAPVSVLYEELHLAPQAGDRIKSHLLKLGYIAATPVTVRTGRGGRAIILSATNAGYEYLGITPRRGSRGGGIAHSLYCQQITKHIKDAHQEVAMHTADGATKCVDVLFRYQPDDHEPVVIALNEYGATLNGSIPMLAPNALVAIEIEITDPLNTNNITKNHAAGISTTIVGVLPNDVKTVTTKLPALLPAGLAETVIVIDVLALLDGVRQGSERTA